MAQAISNTLNSNLSTSTQRKLGIGKPSTYNYQNPAYQGLVSGVKKPTPTNNYQSPAISALTQGLTKPTTPVAVSKPTQTQIPETVTTPKASIPVTTQSPVTTPKDSTNYKGLVERLVNSTTPNKNQNEYSGLLKETALGNKAIGEDARKISEQYGKEIARVGQLGAGAVAGNLTTGTNVVGAGNAAIASQSASNRINALSTGLASQLQGTQQQLTAQGQTAEGYSTGLGAANIQQQQAISGLGTAAGLTQPSPSQYGQTVFNPLTGEFAGGNMDPQVQAQNLAQQVMSGRMTYDQALASLGYAGQAGTNFLNNAITGAGGNPLQLQAQSAGQQANIATQTTASTDIARQGLGQATQEYVDMTKNAEYANQQAEAVSTILEQTGLNNISSTDYNKALINIQGRFSDVNRAALNTAFIEAQAAYTNLLATTGGTPSGREAQAISALNMNSSAAAINASIQELESAVARRLQAQYNAVQQYGQNLGGGNTGYGGGNSNQPLTWDSVI